MRVLVQWARANPQDWEAFGASDWRHTPPRPVPSEIGGRDDVPGWVTRLNVQGVDICGYDHYAVEPLPDGGCRITVWKDDPADLVGDALGEFYARVITFLPLAPDARFGGAWNTRQSQVVYAGPKLAQFYRDNPTENTEVRPWAEFVPPSPLVTRHGIWMPDALMVAHDARLTRARCDWREWTEGVPGEEIVGGRVREQRPLGRYNRPKGTKTYGLRSTDQNSGTHAATNQNAMTRDAFGAGETENVVLTGGSSGLHWVWTTASNTEPDVADWPSGNYRCQLDCSVAGADVSYGLRTAGAVTGHFARMTNETPAMDLQTFAQTQALFTGTGLKLATTGTIDPTAGATTDRFECLLAATRAASHGSQDLTMRYSADAFADGPWVVGQTLTPTPVTSAFAAPAPTLLTGGVTKTPDPVSFAAAVQTPVVVKGGVTMLPTPVSFALSVQAPTIIEGPVIVAPSPVGFAYSVATPIVSTTGPQTVTPDAIIAAFSVAAPTVVKGGVILTPGPITAAYAVITPTVLRGPVILTPAAAQMAFGVQGVTVLTGPLILTPDPVTGTFGIAVPVITGGEQAEIKYRIAYWSKAMGWYWDKVRKE